MAKFMNNFVVNIGKSVEQKIPTVDKHYSFVLDKSNRYSITLNPCSTNEILKNLIHPNPLIHLVFQQASSKIIKMSLLTPS